MIVYNFFSESLFVTTNFVGAMSLNRSRNSLLSSSAQWALFGSASPSADAKEDRTEEQNRLSDEEAAAADAALSFREQHQPMPAVRPSGNRPTQVVP